jgi:hypothetical protein
MIIRTSKKDHPFALIDKTGLEDYNLTWDAKGILCYVLSKPDDWKVHIKELAQNSADGITVVRTAIAELIQAGYVSKKRIFNSKTKCIEGVEYIFYESPQIKKEANQKTIKKTKKVTKNNKNNQKINNSPQLEKLNVEQSIEIKDIKKNSIENIWEQYVEFRSPTKPISEISIKKISQKLFEKGGEDFEIWAVEKAIEKEYYSFKIDTLWTIYLREQKNNTQKTTKKNKNFNLERDYGQHSDNQSTGIGADDRSTNQQQPTNATQNGTTDWEDDEV